MMAAALLPAGGCSRQPAEGDGRTEALTLVLPGFTIDAPAEPGWTAPPATDPQAVFEKHTAGTSIRLSASSVATESFPDDATFLKFAEERQKGLLSPFHVVSNHYNDRHFLGTACLEYDGIFRDEAADPAQLWINTKGYFCRHPESAGQAVWMEYVERSGSKRPADLERALDSAEAFFNSLQFSRGGPARAL
jgi:hypothetical protein